MKRNIEELKDNSKIWIHGLSTLERCRGKLSKNSLKDMVNNSKEYNEIIYGIFDNSEELDKLSTEILSLSLEYLDILENYPVTGKLRKQLLLSQELTKNILPHSKFYPLEKQKYPEQERYEILFNAELHKQISKFKTDEDEAMRKQASRDAETYILTGKKEHSQSDYRNKDIQIYNAMVEFKRKLENEELSRLKESHELSKRQEQGENIKTIHQLRERNLSSILDSCVNTMISEHQQKKKHIQQLAKVCEVE